MGFKLGDYPKAEAYYANSISIPMFHGMTYGQQDEVISKLKAILKG